MGIRLVQQCSTLQNFLNYERHAASRRATRRAIEQPEKPKLAPAETPPPSQVIEAWIRPSRFVEHIHELVQKMSQVDLLL